MLNLYRETGHGEYLTLAGAGIMIDLIAQAILKVGADPNDVVLRVRDGRNGAAIDVMFPTPHTYLFDSVHIHEGNICFVLGNGWKEENAYALPLANPDIVDKLVEAIQRRAKKHRKTKSMINCS